MLTDADLERDRRLLCAANITYEIVDPHLVHAQSMAEKDRNVLHRRLSGLNSFQTFISGCEFTDAAILGVNESEIVLAFRGTQPLNLSNEFSFVESLADWMHDFDADLMRDRWVDSVDWTRMPGRIHRGFLTSMRGRGKKQGLWKQVMPALQALIALHPKMPLCITGHSKGGALAHLAAMQSANFFKQTQIYVCTFAAPRVGDQAFADAYAQKIAASYRYEYHFDVVPLLPPSHGFYEAIAGHAVAKLFKMPLRGYVHVGHKRPVVHDGEIAHSHTPMVNCVTRMIKGEGRQILEYHSSLIGHHYANAVGLGEDMMTQRKV